MVGCSVSEIDDLETLVKIQPVDGPFRTGWSWMRPRTDAELVECVRVLYIDQDKTAAEIEARLGLHKGAVGSLAQKRGWPRKFVGKRSPEPERLERARRLYVSGLSAEEVAKSLGVTGRTVGKWAKAGGWLRTRGGDL